jgi:hypothetical protein
MRRTPVLLMVIVALVAGVWAAAFSMAGVSKPDSVASATMAPPTVSAVSPASGQVGSQVKITGTVFGTTRGTSVVRFNGKETSSYVSWSATQIVCVVPSGATS